VHGADPLRQDSETGAGEDLASAVLDPVEVLGALDEDVCHSECVVKGQGGVVAPASNLLGPDLARDVDQQAAAVALAVDVAGPVKHLLKRGDRQLKRRMARRRVASHRGVDRARVLVLDAGRRDERAIGTLRRVALLRGGAVRRLALRKILGA
jgi:hypothetical protein